jgi:hypothetical protein
MNMDTNLTKDKYMVKTTFSVKISRRSSWVIGWLTDEGGSGCGTFDYQLIPVLHFSIVPSDNKMLAGKNRTCLERKRSVSRLASMIAVIAQTSTKEILQLSYTKINPL